MPVKGSTRNWIVDDVGSSDFQTIQEAIDAASNGDTVLVFAGVYYEHVVVNKTLSLKSLESAVIDASIDPGNKITPTIARWNGITIISDNTIVSGFLVRNAGNHGINIRANYCIVQNNLCQDCSLGGISLYGEIQGYTDVIYNQPDNNIIQDNIVRSCFSGIYSNDAHNNIIIQNNF